MNRVFLTGSLPRVALIAAAPWVMVACNDAVGHPSGEAAGTMGGPPLVLEGAHLIDGTGAATVADSRIVIEDGRFSCVGDASSCALPDDAVTSDFSGRWAIPGIVDTHMHFSQTGWVDGRPDALDLRSDYPYEQTAAWLQNNAATLGRSYLCSGVTAVYDVGGYPWTWSLQEGSDANPRGPIVRSAGPLLTTIDFWLNLPGQAQFIYMADEDAVREAVRSHAAFGANAVKIWYIVRVDADLDRLSALVHLAGEEARAAGLPLIVHATGLHEAKDAIRAGADLLVHSVQDQPVDQEFIDLALEQGTMYTPTLVVVDGYLQVRTREMDREHQPLHCVDPTTLAKVESTDTVPPSRGSYVAGDLPMAREGWAPTLRTGMENLQRIHAAGIPVVMGTDAGNPMTLHGASIYWEMETMVEAGLTAMDVLVAATKNGAVAMGLKDAGTIEPGNWADVVILGADPLSDIQAVRDVEVVIRAGLRHSVEDLQFREPGS